MASDALLQTDIDQKGPVKAASIVSQGHSQESQLEDAHKAFKGPVAQGQPQAPDSFALNATSGGPNVAESSNAVRPNLCLPPYQAHFVFFTRCSTVFW